MTMTDREWELLNKISDRQESMNNRLIVIEGKIITWSKREKVLVKIGVSLLAGFVTWICSGYFPL